MRVTRRRRGHPLREDAHEREWEGEGRDDGRAQPEGGVGRGRGRTGPVRVRGAPPQPSGEEEGEGVDGEDPHSFPHLSRRSSDEPLVFSDAYAGGEGGDEGSLEAEYDDDVSGEVPRAFAPRFQLPRRVCYSAPVGDPPMLVLPPPYGCGSLPPSSDDDGGGGGHTLQCLDEEAPGRSPEGRPSPSCGSAAESMGEDPPIRAPLPPPSALCGVEDECRASLLAQGTRYVTQSEVPEGADGTFVPTRRNGGRPVSPSIHESDVVQGCGGGVGEAGGEGGARQAGGRAPRPAGPSSDPSAGCVVGRDLPPPSRPSQEGGGGAGRVQGPNGVGAGGSRVGGGSSSRILHRFSTAHTSSLDGDGCRGCGRGSAAAQWDDRRSPPRGPWGFRGEKAESSQWLSAKGRRLPCSACIQASECREPGNVDPASAKGAGPCLLCGGVGAPLSSAGATAVGIEVRVSGDDARGAEWVTVTGQRVAVAAATAAAACTGSMDVVRAWSVREILTTACHVGGGAESCVLDRRCVGTQGSAARPPKHLVSLFDSLCDGAVEALIGGLPSPSLLPPSECPCSQCTAAAGEVEWGVCGVTCCAYDDALARFVEQWGRGQRAQNATAVGSASDLDERGVDVTCDGDDVLTPVRAASLATAYAMLKACESGGSLLGGGAAAVDALLSAAACYEVRFDEGGGCAARASVLCPIETAVACRGGGGVMAPPMLFSGCVDWRVVVFADEVEGVSVSGDDGVSIFCGGPSMATPCQVAVSFSEPARGGGGGRRGASQLGAGGGGYEGWTDGGAVRQARGTGVAYYSDPDASHSEESDEGGERRSAASREGRRAGEFAELLSLLYGGGRGGGRAPMELLEALRADPSLRRQLTAAVLGRSAGRLTVGGPPTRRERDEAVADALITHSGRRGGRSVWEARRYGRIAVRAGPTSPGAPSSDGSRGGRDGQRAPWRRGWLRTQRPLAGRVVDRYSQDGSHDVDVEGGTGMYSHLSEEAGLEHPEDEEAVDHEVSDLEGGLAFPRSSGASHSDGVDSEGAAGMEGVSEDGHEFGELRLRARREMTVDAGVEVDDESEVEDEEDEEDVDEATHGGECGDEKFSDPSIALSDAVHSGDSGARSSSSRGSVLDAYRVGTSGGVSEPCAGDVLVDSLVRGAGVAPADANVDATSEFAIGDVPATTLRQFRPPNVPRDADRPARSVSRGLISRGLWSYIHTTTGRMICRALSAAEAGEGAHAHGVRGIGLSGSCAGSMPPLSSVWSAALLLPPPRPVPFHDDSMAYAAASSLLSHSVALSGELAVLCDGARGDGWGGGALRSAVVASAVGLMVQVARGVLSTVAVVVCNAPPLPTGNGRSVVNVLPMFEAELSSLTRCSSSGNEACIAPAVDVATAAAVVACTSCSAVTSAASTHDVPAVSSVLGPVASSSRTRSLAAAAAAPRYVISNVIQALGAAGPAEVMHASRALVCGLVSALRTPPAAVCSESAHPHTTRTVYTAFEVPHASYSSVVFDERCEVSAFVSLYSPHDVAATTFAGRGRSIREGDTAVAAGAPVAGARDLALALGGGGCWPPTPAPVRAPGALFGRVLASTPIARRGGRSAWPPMCVGTNPVVLAFAPTSASTRWGFRAVLSADAPETLGAATALEHLAAAVAGWLGVGCGASPCENISSSPSSACLFRGGGEQSVSGITLADAVRSALWSGDVTTCIASVASLVKGTRRVLLLKTLTSIACATGRLTPLRSPAVRCSLCGGSGLHVAAKGRVYLCRYCVSGSSSVTPVLSHVGRDFDTARPACDALAMIDYVGSAWAPAGGGRSVGGGEPQVGEVRSRDVGVSACQSQRGASSDALSHSTVVVPGRLLRLPFPPPPGSEVRATLWEVGTLLAPVLGAAENTSVEEDCGGGSVRLPAQWFERASARAVVTWSVAVPSGRTAAAALTGPAPFAPSGAPLLAAVARSGAPRTAALAGLRGSASRTVALRHPTGWRVTACEESWVPPCGPSILHLSLRGRALTGLVAADWPVGIGSFEWRGSPEGGHMAEVTPVCMSSTRKVYCEIATAGRPAAVGVHLEVVVRRIGETVDPSPVEPAASPSVLWPTAAEVPEGDVGVMATAGVMARTMIALLPSGNLLVGGTVESSACGAPVQESPIPTSPEVYSGGAPPPVCILVDSVNHWVRLRGTPGTSWSEPVDVLKMARRVAMEHAMVGSTAGMVDGVFSFSVRVRPAVLLSAPAGDNRTASRDPPRVSLWFNAGTSPFGGVPPSGSVPLAAVFDATRSLMSAKPLPCASESVDSTHSQFLPATPAALAYAVRLAVAASASRSPPPPFLLPASALSCAVCVCGDRLPVSEATRHPGGCSYLTGPDVATVVALAGSAAVLPYSGALGSGSSATAHGGVTLAAGGSGGASFASWDDAVVLSNRGHLFLRGSVGVMTQPRENVDVTKPFLRAPRHPRRFIFEVCTSDLRRLQIGFADGASLRQFGKWRAARAQVGAIGDSTIRAPRFGAHGGLRAWVLDTADATLTYSPGCEEEGGERPHNDGRGVVERSEREPLNVDGSPSAVGSGRASAGGSGTGADIPAATADGEAGGLLALNQERSSGLSGLPSPHTASAVVVKDLSVSWYGADIYTCCVDLDAAEVSWFVNGAPVRGLTQVPATLPIPSSPPSQSSAHKSMTDSATVDAPGALHDLVDTALYPVVAAAPGTRILVRFGSASPILDPATVHATASATSPSQHEPAMSVGQPPLVVRSIRSWLWDRQRVEWRVGGWSGGDTSAVSWWAPDTARCIDVGAAGGPASAVDVFGGDVRVAFEAQFGENKDVTFEGSLGAVFAARQLAVLLSTFPHSALHFPLPGAVVGAVVPVVRGLSAVAGQRQRSVFSFSDLDDCDCGAVHTVAGASGVVVRPASDTASVATLLLAARRVASTAVTTVVAAVQSDCAGRGLPPKVTLNRHRAASLAGDAALRAALLPRTSAVVPSSRALSALVGSLPSASLLSQMAILLADVAADTFRTDRPAFRVNLVGEGAEDVGGPYREAITTACSDASTAIPLFRPGTNAAVDGPEPDACPIDPRATRSAVALHAAHLVGRLFGMALLSNQPLPICLPSLTWAALAGSPISPTMLNSVDVAAMNGLRMAGCPVESGVDEDSFEELFELSYSTTLTAASASVIPRGSQVGVHFASAAAYAAWALRSRLTEAVGVASELTSGLLDVVPQPLLAVMGAARLGLSVSGVPQVTVSVLRASARWAPEAAPRAALLFNALETFTDAQRRLFLRFVSGRDRPPVPLTITALPTPQGASADNQLPTASTCFLWIAVPDYSSSAVLRERLLLALTACGGLDGDFHVRAFDANAQPTLSTADPDDVFETFDELVL